MEKQEKKCHERSSNAADVTHPHTYQGHHFALSSVRLKTKFIHSVIRHHSTELKANRQLLKKAICHFRP